VHVTLVLSVVVLLFCCCYRRSAIVNCRLVPLKCLAASIRFALSSMGAGSVVASVLQKHAGDATICGHVATLLAQFCRPNQASVLMARVSNGPRYLSSIGVPRLLLHCCMAHVRVPFTAAAAAQFIALFAEYGASGA
jgi:hypothetical protein